MSGSELRPRAERWGTLAGFVLLYVALGFAGRATLIHDTAFALIWPAGGVAVLWFLVRGARMLSLDTLLLGAAVVGINAITGASLGISLVLLISNLTQTLLAVWLVRRWCGDLWACGGDRPLETTRALVHYMAAAVIATAAGALLGSLGFAVVSRSLDGVGTLLWFGRNLCSVLTLTTLGLLVGKRLTTARPRARLLVSGPAGSLELVTASIFTVGMYALAFGFDDLPLTFPLLAVTAWVGLRFATILSAVHATVIGAATVALTLRGIGPFALGANPELGALVAQFYVATIVVTALALAIGRDERQTLTATLRRTQGEAIYEASLREAIIGSMEEAMVVIDEEGTLLLRNEAALAILERGGEGARSLYGVGATHPDGSPLLPSERASTRALHGEVVTGLEVLVELPGTGTRILTISAAPLPVDDNSGLARALLVSRDVTDEHARREELAAFAGVVAHDLRNPLAAIDGWTDMIADEVETGHLEVGLASEFVARVRSSSERMRELISDLLEHATSRARDLDVSRVDVGGLVAEVVAARHAEGSVTCGPVPAVEADPVLVRQVLDNLIGNALKYVAPDRPARITVAGALDTTGPGLVTVCVADNGIGLPPGEHDKIFAEFHRAHHRDFEGNGLGLSIVRRIVERHAGTIIARDDPDGQGTVFEFTLPVFTEIGEVGVAESSVARSA